ncbi:stage 0 sporulation protein J family protein [[Clostridium] methylpentosum DSM 5476]|uniref:Stage 0 sporulation protein J family protein n=1 Tax=[Clostridium] methylpentosum DSM 5476 TaxID=537013 RepID=C0EGN4_9FIRM|nr:stage 0 sporulation protein J family protein [[Clostridium] methylpentosum DSM 5476]
MNVNFAKKFEGLNSSIYHVESGYNSLFENTEKENHGEIDMDLLVSFPKNLYPNGITPFYPISPLKREQLTESIKKHGVLQSITIRASTRQLEKYEILASQNRIKISKAVGLKTILYVQKDISDAEATEINIEI